MPEEIKNPLLTAHWEQALTYVAEGSISSEDYQITQEDWLINHIANSNDEAQKANES